jgi:hypothetical protein
MSNRPLTTEQDLIIVEGSVLGDKGRDIAAKAGCSPATVSIYQRGRLKDLIEQVRTRVIDEALSVSADNVIHVIKNYKANQANNKGEEMEKSHGFTASMKNLESAGVLASNVQSVTIQQIYNDNRNEIPESIKELISAVQKRDMCKSLDEEVIDI